MQRLIDAGWDLDEVDAMGHTPLHVAAGSEEPDSGALYSLSIIESRQTFSLGSEQEVLNDFSPCREQRLCPNSLTGVIVLWWR
jgi:ankyrin repeat protein